MRHTVPILKLISVLPQSIFVFIVRTYSYVHRYMPISSFFLGSVNGKNYTLMIRSLRSSNDFLQHKTFMKANKL